MTMRTKLLGHFTWFQVNISPALQKNGCPKEVADYLQDRVRYYNTCRRSGYLVKSIFTEMGWKYGLYKIVG